LNFFITLFFNKTMMKVDVKVKCDKHLGIDGVADIYIDCHSRRRYIKVPLFYM
jgi:hypothetical protein